jgi:hypothetical protein
VIISFWVLIIPFLLNHGREKVNNNSIFWQIKKPRISERVRGCGGKRKGYFIDKKWGIVGDSNIIGE